MADVVALDAERARRTDISDQALQTAGGMLQAAREALNLDIAELARRTNIKQGHLTAIEAMDLSALPSQPYTMGFVRAYAREVQLPEDALMERFRQQAGWSRREQAPKVTSAAPRRSSDGSRELSVVALVAILAFIMWVAWRILAASPTEVQSDSGRFEFSKDDRTETVIGASRPETDGEAAAESSASNDLVDRLNRAAGERRPQTNAEIDSPTPSNQTDNIAPNDRSDNAEAEARDEAAPLRRLSAVDPVYPPLCENSAEPLETVTIRYNVSVRGVPSSPQIIGSSNPCFNGAASAALIRWRYAPSSVTADNSRGLTTTFTFERPF